MKLAIGLFHFNPHWNLNVWSSHRHCGEALAPFLRVLSCHRNWRVSVHVSGLGLEFLDKEYPAQFDLLRGLVKRGQIELLSALYTPSLWIAFPRRDLIKSIELNRRCLAKLGLPYSKTFYAHEAFFGTGVSALREYFDAAICRDDYLSYYYDLDFAHSLFTLGGMKIVLASGHLLNEFLNFPVGDPPVLYNSHLQHVSRSSPLNAPEHFPARRGASNSLEWFWYHCGDGNHFSSISKPDNLDHCFYDSEWATAVVQRLCAYEENGYSIANVGTLTSALDYSKAQELPPLVEGGGNPCGAGGIVCWMGRNDSPWEDDAAVLSRIARARARVVLAEWLVQRHQRQVSKHAKQALEEAWVSILHAEISDGLGWHAGSSAVENALQAADSALIRANKVLDEIALSDPEDVNRGLNRPLPSPVPVRNLLHFEPELFGADGTAAYTEISSAVVVYDCEFKATANVCGIKFPFSMKELVFCPSGCETTCQRIPVEVLRADVVTLPLTNGLIQLDQDTFLVKDTCYIHLAATILLTDHRLEYSIANPKKDLRYRWRFYILSTSVEDAIGFANALNASADPYSAT